MTSANFIDLLRAAGYEPRPYSGRGMAGLQCIAVDLENIEGAFTLGATLAEAASDGETRKTLAFSRYAQPAIDSIGMEWVAYWPRLAW